MIRIEFAYRPPLGFEIPDWRSAVPNGFTVTRLNHALTSELQSALLAARGSCWFQELWGGVENFMDGGFGFVAIGNEGIACNCRACWVRDGKVPLQVSTRIYARRSGLATAVCTAFIEHCLACDLIPTYECDEDNVASIALALKLGFRESKTT